MDFDDVKWKFQCLYNTFFKYHDMHLISNFRCSNWCINRNVLVHAKSQYKKTFEVINKTKRLIIIFMIYICIMMMNIITDFIYEKLKLFIHEVHITLLTITFTMSPNHDWEEWHARLKIKLNYVYNVICILYAYCGRGTHGPTKFQWFVNVEISIFLK